MEPRSLFAQFLVAGCPAVVHPRPHRWRSSRGLQTTGALMNVMVLASVAALCGLAAIWLFLQQSKNQELLRKAQDRADKAEADARKEAEKAEAARKRVDQPRDAAPKEDKLLKETKAVAVAAKEEVKRLQAAVKRVEQEKNEIEIKTRRFEGRVEELTHALEAASHKKPSAVVVAPAPAPEPIAAPPVREAPAEVVLDERALLRKAELEAERAARMAEAEKARTEREAARAARSDDKLQEFVEKLKAERERLRQMLFDRELVLRIERKKGEHNRRAYMMTMGALDLAEDELYRIKHGRERPELVTHRHDEAGFDSAEREDEVSAEAPVVASAEEVAEARAAVAAVEAVGAAELAAAEAAAVQEAAAQEAAAQEVVEPQAEPAQPVDAGAVDAEVPAVPAETAEAVAADAPTEVAPA